MWISYRIIPLIIRTITYKPRTGMNIHGISPIMCQNKPEKTKNTLGSKYFGYL